MKMMYYEMKAGKVLEQIVLLNAKWEVAVRGYLDGDLWGRNFKGSHYWSNVVFSETSVKLSAFFEIMFFKGSKARPRRSVYYN